MLLSDILMSFPDSGSETALQDYLAGLDALEAVEDEVDVVVPGHGSPGTDIPARIALDRAYVLAVRDGELPDDPRIQPGAGRDTGGLAACRQSRQGTRFTRGGTDR